MGSTKNQISEPANITGKRLPRAEAERLVEELLESEKPGFPTFSLREDGETGWAFWIDPEDTTSYLDAKGNIQWSGSSWPEYVEYDSATGNFIERVQSKVPAVEELQKSASQQQPRPRFRP